MALAETQLVVQFRGGVETKEDRKGVLPTKLLALENAVFTKAITTTKRFGYEDLGTSVMGADEPMPTALALGKRGDELLAFTADTVYSRIEDTGRWIEAGQMRSVITDSTPVAKTGTNQTLADHAIGDGVALYAWEDSAGGTWYALLDDETGRVLVAPTQVSAAATRPRCIALGSSLCLLYALPTPRELRLLQFSRAEPTSAPVQRTLVTDLSPTVPAFDLAAKGTDGVLAWVRDTGAIGVAYLHASGVLGGPVHGLPTQKTVAGAVQTALGVCASDDHVALAWDDTGATVKYATLAASDLSAVHAARTVATEAAQAVRLTCAFDGREEDGEATLWVLYELAAAQAQDHLVKGARADVSASALTVHDSWTQRGVGLASKAFRHGTDVYLHVGRDSTLYRTYYTLRARDRLVVARHLSGLGNGHPSRAHLPSVWPGEGSTWSWPAIYVIDVDSGSGEVFSESGIRKVVLDFASDEAFRSVELGATTYIAGGFLHAYDGQRVVEAEFHYGIDDVLPPVQSAATGGAGLAAGTYNYVFALENVLASGEIQRGPVSAPITVVVPTDGRRVTFEVPTYRLTAMPNARIGAYRTIDGDESVYSRVTSYDPGTAGEVNGYLANATTADTVTFIDEMDDDTLEAQDPLYMNGGIPPNDPLGGAQLVASGKGRMFVVDKAAPLTVFYSQERAAGYAVETTPLLRFEVDPHGGPITGIAVMDDSLVILKETAIFHVTGPGPLPNPALGGGWSPPELIPSDAGCLSPDSLCLSPVGVVFQSEKGIELLGRDRAMAVPRLGSPVDAFKDQRIVAATLIEDRTQIRFLVGSGQTLSYDYERGQWSTFTNHEGLDAVLVGGRYHYLRRSGRVWRETTGYADGGAQIRKVVETAWANLAGHLQGQFRAWWVTLIGEFKSAHKLRVYLAFDYQDGWHGDPILIDPSEGRVEGNYGDGAYGDGVYGGGADTRYQFQIHVGQECQAIRFRFEDVEADGDFGASFELNELHITGGVERSSFTVEEARRY